MIPIQISCRRHSKNIFIDPLGIFLFGYRYNQDNHLFYQIVMVHCTAYFFYDSVIEIYYKTDNFLMNLHHVCVCSVSLWQLSSRNSGFEFLVLHWMAESSNPSLIMRSILKINGKKNTSIYKINELIFAAIYLPVRMILTPIALIYMYEADQVIYGTKFGVTFVLYIQLFWCY